jgi:lipoprotein-anchoring transpeptidase ErfK/SrfK
MRSLTLVAVMCLATGCRTLQTTRKPPATRAPATPAPVFQSYWEGDGVQGDPAIVIDLAEQRAYFYKGSRVVSASRISSGKKGFETPPGSYKVIQRDKDHVSNLYGNFVDEAGNVVKRDVDTSKDKAPPGATFQGAKMPYFLRFTGGYGLHAGRVPNYPASHGCVRLPRTIAPHFFHSAAIGTPVTVRN